MSTIPFRLIPFGVGDPAPGSVNEALEITGTLAISDGGLQITYHLRGDLGALAIAPPASQPERRDQLWQTTCLELFLARPGQDDYWEYNLSPAGHWNVYHLEGYRQGLTPEPAYQQLPFGVQTAEQQPNQPQCPDSNQSLCLTLRCPLPPLGRQGVGSGLELGITAVIEHRTSGLSYWALHHPAAEADFHHRGGFCIKLA